MASLRTYAFKEPLGTDRGDYSSVVSTYLKTATARELQARGYQPAAATAEPDFLVNFDVYRQEKLKATTTPTSAAYMGGPYGYRRGYYTAWPAYETQVTQYTEGTLTVDIIHTARKQMIWEGVAVGRVREKDRKNMEQTADSVIGQVFENFPVQGGGAPAAK